MTSSYLELTSQRVVTNLVTGQKTTNNYSSLYPYTVEDDVRARSTSGKWPLFAGLANCTSPYQRRIMRNSPAMIDYSSYREAGGNGYYDRGTCCLDLSSVWRAPSLDLYETQKSLAKLGLLKKMQQMGQLAQGGVFLAELHRTIQMIRHPAQALRRSVGRFLSVQERNRRRPNAVRQSILADSYLEYVFGWLPLIGDIDDLISYAGSLLEKERKRRLRYRVAIASTGVVGDIVSTRVALDAGTSSSWKVRYSDEGGIEYLGDFLVKLEGARGNALGVSMRNFVPTLWELLPWSFLIDYFANIGDLLTLATGSYPDNRWTSASIMVRRKYTATCVDRGLPSLILSQTSVKAGVEIVNMQRWVPNLELDLSDFHLRVPGLDDQAGKWLNIAALLASKSRLSIPNPLTK